MIDFSFFDFSPFIFFAYLLFYVFFTDTLPKIEVYENNVWFFELRDRMKKYEKIKGLVYVLDSLIYDTE